jgi:hypothetical protein
MPLVTTTDGSYEFSYKVPTDKAAGQAVLRVEHPASNDFAGTAATALIDIARATRIDTLEPDAFYRGVPAEARARLLDADGPVMRTSFPGQQVPRPTVMFWLRQGGKETYLGERSVDKDGYSAIGIETDRSTPLGPAQVRFYFSGNEFYGPAEAIRDMVFKAHTEVDITSPKTAFLAPGNTLEVTGDVLVVSSESSTVGAQDPIVKNDVQVFLDGNLIGTATTDDKGHLTFTHDVTGVDLGSAVIRVAFPGDKVYEPSEATVDFSILPDTDFAAGGPKDIYKGENATVEGYLFSAQGPVQGIVEISVGSMFFTKVATGMDGGFSVNYKVPLTTELGPMPVTLTYRGSKLHRATTATLQYTVMAKTILLVPKDPVTVRRGAAVSIRGSLVEDWDGQPGNPVVGAYIYLGIPDMFSFPVVTNPDGNFTYIYTPSSKAQVGDITVPANFNGDLMGTTTSTMDSSSADIKLRIISATTLTISVKGPTPATVGSPIQVNAVLSDDNGLPVGGRNVTVVSVTPGSEMVMFKGPTDLKGEISIGLTLNDTGAQTLTVRFKGDANYEASEAISFISLEPHPKVTTPIQRQPTVVLGGGLSLILILTMVMTESGKYFLFKWLLVPMYSKLKKEDVLDHFVRGQIYGLIRLQPGAHYNFIKQKLDLKNGVLSYHLSTLEREGYVLSEMDGIYRRFYPNSVKFEVDYPIFLSKLQERIVDFIKSRPGLTQKEVAKELGISTSTANDNIQVLSQAQILALKRDGKRTRCYLVES